MINDVWIFTIYMYVYCSVSEIEIAFKLEMQTYNVQKIINNM